MDYPISVPSIGLVGGKFADEDPLAGTPGSLIPAQWGNAVTDEIRNVIIAAGLTPDEMLNTQLASAISLIIGAARPFASQLEAEAGTENTKVMTSLRTAQAIIQRLPSVAPVVGTSRNVRCSIPAASAWAAFTADELVLKAGLGGMAYTLNSFNKTVNLTSIGAGGMDVGAAPVSGFVSIYAIYNPTTQTSALLACNQTTSNGQVYTGANMPAGYTASALVSAWGTTAASLLVAGLQIERRINIALAQINSSTVNQSNTSINIAALVPIAAKEISGLMQIGSSALSNCTMSLSGTVGAVGYGGIGASVAAGTVVQGPFSTISLGTPQIVFYTANAEAGFLSSVAFVNAYTI